MKRVDILNFIASYLGIGISFFLTIARAKIFTVEEVGIYSYILSITMMFSGVLNFGIQRIILKYYNQNKKNDFIKKILKVQIIIFILFTIFYFLLSKLIEINYILFITLLTLNSLMVTNMDILSIVTNKSAKSNLYQKIYMNFLDLFVLGVIFFVKENINIYLYLYIYIAIKYIVLMLMIYLLKENIFIESNEKIKEKEFKGYFYYGMFLMLSTATFILINTIDKIMLKKYIDFKSVGIYTISLTISNIIGMIGNVFSRSVSPRISKCLEEKNKIKLEKIYKENVKQQIYIGLFLLIYLIMFSKEILGMVGSEYVNGYMVLILIGIGQMINISTGMCGMIIGLSKYYKYDAYFNVFLLIITIGTNILFIPKYGIVGAALATALTIALNNSIKVIFVYKKFKIHPYRLENLKYIIGGVIVTIILFIIKLFVRFNIIEIGIMSIVMFGTYDIILYLLKEKELLILKLKKINIKKLWD